MRKVMLIDDRTARQVSFYDETGIDLNKYSDVLDNYTASTYEQLLEEFRDNNFSKLDSYEIIITHRSAYSEINNSVISKLKEICKKQKKTIVFFSGGISAMSLSNNTLLLNSKNFYSSNLRLFLEYVKKDKLQILILAFGENWRTNLLLNSLENINLFIGKYSDKKEVSFKKFKNAAKIDLIMNIINFKEPPITNNFVEMKDLKTLAIELSTQIKQQVVLNA